MKAALLYTGRMIFWGVFLCSVATWIAPATYAGELLSNLRFQLAVGATIAVFPLLLARSWKEAGACCIVLCANTAPLAALRWNIRPHGEITITAVTANVLGDNRDPSRFLNWLASTDPDIVAVIESTPLWVDSLDTLRDRYPHQVHYPDPGYFGVSLLSKWPVVAADAIDTGLGNPLMLKVVVERDGENFQILVVHPLPPILPSFTDSRRRLLVAAAALAVQDPTTIMLGDLNTSTFSPLMRDLTATGGLTNHQTFVGRRATWLSGMSAAGLDLDHVLVGQRWGVAYSTVGPDIGSDHRPIVVGIGPR